ncbi:hypothetical protein [Streptomyces sp. NPDC004008]
MDPEIAALAGTAGTTIVTLLATETWQRTRDGLAALWRRAHLERADAVLAELDATRADVLQARAAGDDTSEAELQAEWQGRVRRLLMARPEVVDELRALLDELAPQRDEQSSGVTQHATASGSARVYQAGGNINISER